MSLQVHVVCAGHGGIERGEHNIASLNLIQIAAVCELISNI